MRVLIKIRENAISPSFVVVGATLAVSSVGRLIGDGQAESARLMRAHNDAQMSCFGGRDTAPDLAISYLGGFLSTDFDGGRHETRVGRPNELDKERQG